MYKSEGYTAQEIEAMQLPEGTLVIDHEGDVWEINDTGQLEIACACDYGRYHIVAETPPCSAGA